MAAITISESSLGMLKKALRKDFIDEKSSHLTEALASSLGFQTHAALLAAVAQNAADPPTVLLDTERFVSRLQAFGYPRDAEFDFEFLAGKSGPAISTIPITAYEIAYKSERGMAWRNLMVCAINAGLERKLFSLNPGDNRWPGAVPEAPDGSNRGQGVDSCLFDFVLPTGQPARGYVRDIGWSELSVHVAVNPKGDWLKASNAGFSAGDAFACAWLERERGAWLQTALTEFSCRNSLKPILAGMNVTPLGYGDKGGVIM